MPRSKYQEDIYVHGHTQIYGSFFAKGQWGYKCCRALQKQAYCTGIAGRSGANVPMKAPPVEEEIEEDAEEPKSLMEVNLALPLTLPCVHSAMIGSSYLNFFQTIMTPFPSFTKKGWYW